MRKKRKENKRSCLGCMASIFKGFLALFALLIIIGIIMPTDEESNSESEAYQTSEVQSETLLESIEQEALTETGKQETEKETVLPEDFDDFSITMLDVGQGLSILVEADDQFMLYDGGPRSASSYVASYLKKHDVTDLTYMVASHYDEDHVAGLVGVLNTATVGTVLDGDYEADTKIYASFKDKLSQNGAEEVHPAVGDAFDLGQAKITVISPRSYDNDDANDNSIAIKIDYGSFSAVITGDAEELSEEKMMAGNSPLDSDLYVAGHHGSASSSSTSFVRSVSPEICFISVGADNSYGHPVQSVLDRLSSEGAQIYRSDLHGAVKLSYSEKDGVSIEAEKKADKDLILKSPDSVKEKETEGQKETASSVASGTTYVINTNTGKFHYPSCSSVKDIKESNRWDYEGTRDDVTDMGYSPCGRCHP